MVAANYLADVQSIPWWLKHAPDIGLTPIDLIAPLFMFAIGLTYGPSLGRRRERDGTARAGGHFLRRFLALIGIGAIISTGEILVGKNAEGINWGVLQSIGVAGLVTLPALALPPAARAVSGALLLGGYQAILDAFWLPTVLRSPHGGMQGSLAWAAMLMLATAMSDWRPRRPAGHMRFALAGFVSLAVGIALGSLVPISKNRVSASYVLISIGASGLLFFLVTVAVERLRFHPALLSWWGANPLLLYIGHYLLLAFFVLPDAAWWHVRASAPLLAAQVALLLGVLSVCAWLLARGGRRVSL